MKKPENRMERTNITLPTYYKNILRQDAKRLGISISDCVRRLIDKKKDKVRVIWQSSNK